MPAHHDQHDRLQQQHDAEEHHGHALAGTVPGVLAHEARGQRQEGDEQEQQQVQAQEHAVHMVQGVDQGGVLDPHGADGHEGHEVGQDHLALFEQLAEQVRALHVRDDDLQHRAA